jgi:Fe-S-cluster-containing dehydrogenase component
MDGAASMRKWALVVDVEKCENCGNCFLSCKDEHVGNDWPGYSAQQPDHEQKWINVLGKERGQYPLIDVAYLPVPCMHCDEAPCLKAAERGAVYKRPDGIVIIDPIKARGQKKLVASCPYGAISWNEKLELPQKCTLCAHLLDGGWTNTRCVQSCPTGALSLLHTEDAEVQRYAQMEKLESYLSEHKTKPRVYYKNLHRFSRCFVGGSLVTRNGKTDDCAEGARVTLRNSTGEKIGECVTDNYGDFKFDGLAEDSGKYSLEIIYGGHDAKTFEVEVKKSLNAGVLFV